MNLQLNSVLTGELIVPKVWDLSADSVQFPLLVEQYEIYVRMKQPYENQELKDMLLDFNNTIVPEGDDLTIVPGNSRKLPFFFWKNFLSISGVTKRDGSELTHLEQVEFIKRKSSIIEATIIGGYGNVRRIPTPPIEVSRTGMVFDLDLEKEIQAFQVLKFDDSPETVRIQMSYFFGEPTQGDFQTYHVATRQSRVHRKKQGWSRILNFDTIEILFNSLIRSVTGMIFEGHDLLETNKDKWIKAIPLWHKILMLTELFDEVEAKNV